MDVPARKLLAIPLCFALSACPEKDNGATVGTTGTTGTTGAATGPLTGDVSTSLDPSTTSTTTTTTTTTGSTGTGGTTGAISGSICDPQPADVAADFTIDDNAGQWDELNFIHHCTVASITTDGALTIALEGCKADDDPMAPPVAHTIVAQVAPAGAIDLAVGEEVVLFYVVETPWWSNFAFTLRRPSSELVLAGLRTSELPGEPYGPPAGFFDPLSLSLLSTCELEPPDMPDTGCDFICGDDCYQVRRQTVRIEWSGGATVELIDRSAQSWPDQPYSVVVGLAEGHENISCTDTPDGRVELMLLRHKP